MPLEIEAVPENERHRREIERHVGEFLQRGGEIRRFGVTESEGLRTRREMNQQVGRNTRGKRKADA